MTDAPETIWADMDFQEWTDIEPEGTPEVKYRRADLPPKVKPLEWSSDGYSAVGSHGYRYSISECVYTDYMVVLMNGTFVGNYHSIEEARAAAQADYKRRILGALEV